MDDIHEKEPPDVVTSDTPNATKVRPHEAPPHKERKFEAFRAYNTDLWNGPRRENTELMRRQDDLHRYDAISSQLSLTDFQKKRGRQLLDELDFQELGKPIDQIIFAVCVIAANADVDVGTRYWPHPDATDNDESFAELGEELGLTRRQQLSTVQQIKAAIDF